MKYYTYSIKKDKNTIITFKTDKVLHLMNTLLYSIIDLQLSFKNIDIDNNTITIKFNNTIDIDLLLKTVKFHYFE